MLYELCTKQGIAHRNTKKWVVAQTEQQWADCLKLHEHARVIGVPTRPVSLDEGRRREPDVRATTGILESETTGIVDSHGLMAFLQADFQERGGGCAFHSPVTRIETVDQGRGGYRVVTRDAGSGEDGVVTADTLVNSAGLFACAINNMILPAERHRKPYYAKGSYFSYSASHPKPATLVYPAPEPEQGGLGTHLTLDMAGRVRFGPDTEWVDDPTDLVPRKDRLAEAITAVQQYLPGVDRSAMAMDYCGIRPKLAGPGQGMSDFVIRREEGCDGFVNLLGIESPGLTSSLAIADMVEELLYR
ncbi:MAG: hypothetical protein M1832_001955 [Thelocarpon impressellum]|nr:MAG: hypothetical protein M1832_001955 [Thelocarpon impressellum]